MFLSSSSKKMPKSSTLRPSLWDSFIIHSPGVQSQDTLVDKVNAKEREQYVSGIRITQIGAVANMGLTGLKVSFKFILNYII
jgi:hypothetical protein